MNLSNTDNYQPFQNFLLPPITCNPLCNENKDGSSAPGDIAALEELNDPSININPTPIKNKHCPKTHQRSSHAGMSGSSALPFPFKLHVMLDNAEAEGYSTIVSWEGEDCFLVHSKDSFVKDIIPRYFSQTQYRSFQRLLNMWGFERLRDGPRKGAYTHQHLRRGSPSLCNLMKCQKVKQKQSSAATLKQHQANKAARSSQGKKDLSLASSGNNTAVLPARESSTATRLGGADGSTPVDLFGGKSFHMVSPKDHIDRKFGNN